MSLIYQDSDIFLYCADNLDILPDCCKVDAIITDPPFGINYQNNLTTNKHDKIVGDNEKFSYYPWASLCWPLLRNNRALFAYTGWSEYADHCAQIKQIGYQLKEPLIVQKRASGKTDLYGSFQSNSDWIIFATKGKFTFEPTKLLRNKYAGAIPGKNRSPVPEFKTRFPSCWFGPEFPMSTLNQVSAKFRHPTIKTVELMSWLIQLSTKEGDIVLDPFAGTGTTLKAAKLTSRKAIGIEIRPDYCNMIIENLKI
jgi:DNA modification methylase